MGLPWAQFGAPCLAAWYGTQELSIEGWSRCPGIQFKKGPPDGFTPRASGRRQKNHLEDRGGDKNDSYFARFCKRLFKLFMSSGEMSTILSPHR